MEKFGEEYSQGGSSVGSVTNREDLDNDLAETISRSYKKKRQSALEDIRSFNRQNQILYSRLELLQKDIKDSTQIVDAIDSESSSNYDYLQNSFLLYLGEYEKYNILLEQVRELFFNLTYEGVNFDLEPDIDILRLIKLCGRPPKSCFKEKLVDPIVMKIMERDDYFSNCNSNEEFISRVRELYNKSKRFDKYGYGDSTERARSVSTSKRLPFDIDIPTPCRQNKVTECCNNHEDLTDLINERQKLINAIYELKTNIKNRKASYSNRNETKLLSIGPRISDSNDCTRSLL